MISIKKCNPYIYQYQDVCNFEVRFIFYFLKNFNEKSRVDYSTLDISYGFRVSILFIHLITGINLHILESI